MSVLVITNEFTEYEAPVTIAYVVSGDHEQEVIDFANENCSEFVHEKVFAELQKRCGFESIKGIYHYQGIITNVVKIDIRDCTKCDECRPPLSFPLLIDMGVKVGDRYSKADKIFHLVEERQMDCLIMSYAMNILDNRKDENNTSLFLLVEEDSDGWFVVRAVQPTDLNRDFLRSCERV